VLGKFLGRLLYNCDQGFGKCWGNFWGSVGVEVKLEHLKPQSRTPLTRLGKFRGLSLKFPILLLNAGLEIVW
jgi:hypothetical protein